MPEIGWFGSESSGLGAGGFSRGKRPGAGEFSREGRPRVVGNEALIAAGPWDWLCLGASETAGTAEG